MASFLNFQSGNTRFVVACQSKVTDLIVGSFITLLDLKKKPKCMINAKSILTNC